MRTRRLVLLLIASAATAVFAHHGPGTIRIDAAAKKQPGVTFNHEQHAHQLVKACDTCHHTQKGLVNSEKTKVIPCRTCHLDPEDPKVPTMRELSMTRNPFHIRCTGCHKSEKKGPTACTGCHKKA